MSDDSSSSSKPPPPPPHKSFLPPRMTNSEFAAASLHKQALLGGRSAADPAAPQQHHHHLSAVAEDGGSSSDGDGSSIEATCSRLSLDDGGAAAGHQPCLRHAVPLGSWESYWDAKQSVEVPGRGVFTVYTAGSSGAVVFCLHGGGYTALTWSLVARQLKEHYRVFALDMRGHGGTTTSNDADLSAETMTQDVVAVWQQVLGSSGHVPTLLVGHSMGGALAVRAAASQQVSGLEGVVVIDVVEGTALAALPHMAAVLAARPPGFPSLEAACDWAVRTGTCKNREMAGVSLPSQLVQQHAGQAQQWAWRTNLAASSPYWQGWYEGLSDAFLALRVPKMLLLAGTDRLDKSLTIGQMQGKFQLLLMPTAGHAIQEDEPLKTAEHLQQFLHRFRIGEPPMVIPRARPSVRPVLPVVGGPLHVPPPPPQLQPPAAGAAVGSGPAAMEQ